MKSFLRVTGTFLFRAIFGIGLLTIFCVIYVISSYVADPDRGNNFIKAWLREEESIISVLELPYKRGDLVMTVVPLHPVLSEFRYDVQLALKDGHKIKKTLEIQTGGEPDVTIIWMVHSRSKPYLGFDHDSGGHQVFEFIDLSDGSLRKFSSLWAAKKAYELPQDTHVYTIAWIRDNNLNMESNSGNSTIP